MSNDPGRLGIWSIQLGLANNSFHAGSKDPTVFSKPNTTIKNCKPITKRQNLLKHNLKIRLNVQYLFGVLVTFRMNIKFLLLRAERPHQFKKNNSNK